MVAPLFDQAKVNTKVNLFADRSANNKKSYRCAIVCKHDFFSIFVIDEFVT